MNDLQNALEQLKRRASGQRQAMPPTPKEAQALLDERDALRLACKQLVVLIDSEQWDCPLCADQVGHKELCPFEPVERQARIALAKTRNEEAQP